MRQKLIMCMLTYHSETNIMLLMGAGYVLLYEKRSQPSTQQQVDLQPGLTSFTIQNLSPVTNYTIYVAALTSKGRGQLVSADIQSGVPPGLHFLQFVFLLVTVSRDS